jgi:hypothetical protein
MSSAMTLALLIGFILLPAISVSDDLMAARQSAMPLSGQTWKIASDNAATGFGGTVAPDPLLEIVISFVTTASMAPYDQLNVNPIAERLARAQRLRPPPLAA